MSMLLTAGARFALGRPPQRPKYGLFDPKYGHHHLQLLHQNKSSLARKITYFVSVYGFFA